MNAILPSKYAQEAIALAFKKHWRFRIVGSGKPLNEAVYRDEWWYTPVTETDIPNDAKKRLEALRKAGIRVSGLVVAHESPRLLSEPVKLSMPQTAKAADPLPFIQVIVFIFSIFFQAILLDPALIVVLEDGTWLEVMTWYE